MPRKSTRPRPNDLLTKDEIRWKELELKARIAERDVLTASISRKREELRREKRRYTRWH